MHPRVQAGVGLASSLTVGLDKNVCGGGRKSSLVPFAFSFFVIFPHILSPTHGIQNLCIFIEHHS